MPYPTPRAGSRAYRGALAGRPKATPNASSEGLFRLRSQPEMAPRQATHQAVNTALQNGGPPGQRERLTAAMITSGNRGGYASATVSAVIKEAGVSRPTFYEFFRDRDDCFTQTLAQAQAMLLAATSEEIERSPPQQATEAALKALIDLARREPEAVRFVTNEPLAASHLALAARDETLAQTARLIAVAQRGLPRKLETPDIAPEVLFGAAHRLLGSQMRRGEPGLTTIHQELLAWVRSYRAPRAEHRWQTLKPGPKPTGPPVALESLLSEPPPLAPGRPRLSSEEIAANHRQRVLLAVACVAQEKGYEASTVTDIARRAKLDPKVFYRLFADKQDAFMRCHDLGFRHLIPTMASAFFNGGDWPQRSWQAGHALLAFLEAEPLLAYIGVIEAHSVGAQAVQRVEDSHVAFTIFLEEGYLYAEPEMGASRQPAGRLALEAIVAASHELVYQKLRTGQAGQLTRHLGQVGSLVLTPFLGPAKANRFIDEQLGAEAKQR